MGLIGVTNLDRPPPKSEIDWVCDFFELLCLDDEDGFAGFSDLARVRSRQRDTGRAGDQSLTGLMEGTLPDSPLREEPDEGMEADLGDEPARLAADAENDPDADPSTPEDAPELPSPEIADIRSHLLHRAAVLGDGYPFGVGDDGIDRLEMTPARRLYAALLICSCQRFIPDEDCPQWRTFFERFSRHPLEAYFGARAKIEIFGTSAREGERYHLNARDAIEMLSRDLRLTLLEAYDDVTARGDFGLDLVGEVCFADADEADLRLAIFAQCASGKDWREKQEEAGPGRWGRVLSESSPRVQAFLMPYFFRKTSGDWARPSWLHKTNVVFDRQRILFLVGDVPPLEEAPELLSLLT